MFVVYVNYEKMQRIEKSCSIQQNASQKWPQGKDEPRVVAVGFIALKSTEVSRASVSTSRKSTKKVGSKHR